MTGKILAAWFLCAAMAVAQTATPPATAAPATPATPATTPASTPAKAYTFDVVSIRQNNTPLRLQKGIQQSGPTADGYRLTNEGLLLVLVTAYVPQVGGVATYAQGHIKGLPDWVISERYDIDARISDEDRAAWQNPAQQKVMLQSMLQAMLADRCKLAVHREVKEGTVYSLVVAKGGPKFKETDPKAEHPEGHLLPGGGVSSMTYSNEGLSFKMGGASVASLASLLSNLMLNSGQIDGTVQDKTGLTGRYDFVVTVPRGQGDVPGTASDPAPGTFVFTAVEALGLKLEKSKGPVETLVIDHIERPSPN